MYDLLLAARSNAVVLVSTLFFALLYPAITHKSIGLHSPMILGLVIINSLDWAGETVNSTVSLRAGTPSIPLEFRPGRTG